jgi:hypothetical protein
MARMLLVLMIIARGLYSSQSLHAQTISTAPIWSQIGGIDPTTTFKAVFMVDQQTAWAAGSAGPAGVVYRLTLQNGRWNATQYVSFEQPLNGIAVTPAGTIWVVGEQGLIASSRARNQWVVQQVLPGASLRAIQILGNDQRRWVGGTIPRIGGEGEAVMLRGEGEQWVRDSDVQGDGIINSLHFDSNDGWAVGSRQIWHYSGNRWQAEPEPAACGDTICSSGLASVRTLAGGEVWAVGSRIGHCAICSSYPYAIHRSNGAWQVVLPDTGITGWNPPPTPLNFAGLRATSFVNSDFGIAVGAWFDSAGRRGTVPLAIRYVNGRWSAMDVPTLGHGLNAISVLDPTHALSVGDGGLVLAYGYGQQNDGPIDSSPVQRVQNPHTPTVAYFEATGHTLRGAFQSYWQAHGGLAQFGYPRTEEFREISPTDGQTYVVQYFERARFEYHPELAGTGYEVLLGLLGQTVTANRMYEEPFKPATPSANPGAHYYPETQHNLAPQFAARWNATGGLAVYGYPISEVFSEVSPTDGKTYIVQYFERNRFEYHPELAGTPYEVLLGLLGSEVLKPRGWLP